MRRRQVTRANTSRRKTFYASCVKTNSLWHDCIYCETPIFYILAEFDHMVPISQQQKHTTNNLVICCRECNRRKLNTPLLNWLKLEGIAPERLYRQLIAQNKCAPVELRAFLGLL